MRFAIARNLEPRERRTIVAGGLLVALVALTTQLVLPFARRWSDREALIAARRQRLAQLHGIAGHEAEIRARVKAREEGLAGNASVGPRLVRARTAALAASALQTLLRDHAAASGVAVTRLDAAGTVEALGGSAGAVPATVSAVGDVYGVARFLQLLQHGPRLLDVRDLTIATNPSLRSGLLQLSVTVHAPFVSGE